MKSLFIVRHGEAAIAPHGPDRNRPLTERGGNDVARMAQRLAPHHRPGQPVAVSAALRTVETAAALAKAWGRDPATFDVRDEGYLAEYMTWMRWMAGWPDDAQTGWIVGHNPGLSALVYHITGKDVLLPPCGVAEITCNVNRWVEVSGRLGKLQALLTPH